MYGRPPTWSSWAWVMRNALTFALRSRRYVISGTTRSMPNISSSGNMRPQSTTTMSSPYSNTYMFLPISPTPPSGMMRRSWSGDAITFAALSEPEEASLLGGLGLDGFGGFGGCAGLALRGWRQRQFRRGLDRRPDG